jgi:hypothetical protein
VTNKAGQQLLVAALALCPAVKVRCQYYPDREHAEMGNLTLRKRAMAFDLQSILELGERGDSDSIPLLRELAENPTITEATIRKITVSEPRPGANRLRFTDLTRPHLAACFAARAALTKMKANDYFDAFIVELSTTNRNWRDIIIADLGYIGDLRALRFIGPYLFDEKCSDPKPNPNRKFLCPTPAETTSEAIGRIVELQPEIGEHPATGFGHYHEWQKWWANNHAKYQDSLSSNTRAAAAP